MFFRKNCFILITSLSILFASCVVEPPPLDDPAFCKDSLVDVFGGDFTYIKKEKKTKHITYYYYYSSALETEIIVRGDTEKEFGRGEKLWTNCNQYLLEESLKNNIICNIEDYFDKNEIRVELSGNFFVRGIAYVPDIISLYEDTSIDYKFFDSPINVNSDNCPYTVYIKDPENEIDQEILIRSFCRSMSGSFNPSKIKVCFYSDQTLEGVSSEDLTVTKTYMTYCSERFHDANYYRYYK